MSTRIAMSEALRVLDTFSGLSTSVCGALRAGFSVERYTAVEIEERTRIMAAHHLRLLHDKYGPGRLPVSAMAAAFTAVPQDITQLTEEHIVGLGRIDVFLGSWPCQGLSAANKRGRGLADPRSGLLRTLLQVMRWVLQHNPQVAWIIENVDFSDGRSKEWREVCVAFAELGGAPLCFDAARVSPEHRCRAYWSNLNHDGRMQPPEPRPDRDLATALGPYHVPRLAPTSDPPVSYRLVCNEQGKPMRKYPAATKWWAEGAHNQKNGTAYVVNVHTKELELPYVYELERIVGLDPGATAAPGATEDDRRKACGNIFDGHVYTWFFEKIAERRGLAAAPAQQAQEAQHAEQAQQQGAWAALVAGAAWHPQQQQQPAGAGPPALPTPPGVAPPLCPAVALPQLLRGNSSGSSWGSGEASPLASQMSPDEWESLAAAEAQLADAAQHAAAAPGAPQHAGAASTWQPGQPGQPVPAPPAAAGSSWAQQAGQWQACTGPCFGQTGGWGAQQPRPHGQEHARQPVPHQQQQAWQSLPPPPTQQQQQRAASVQQELPIWHQRRPATAPPPQQAQHGGSGPGWQQAPPACAAGAFGNAAGQQAGQGASTRGGATGLFTTTSTQDSW